MFCGGKLISRGATWSIIECNIFLWLKINFSGKKWFLVTRRSKIYVARASLLITLSRAKCLPRRWNSHKAEYFIPPWSCNNIQSCVMLLWIRSLYWVVVVGDVSPILVFSLDWGYPLLVRLSLCWLLVGGCLKCEECLNFWACFNFI